MVVSFIIKCTFSSGFQSNMKNMLPIVTFQAVKTSLPPTFSFLLVYVVCKLGNDSQTAVQLLEKMSGTEVEDIMVKDITGGLMAWVNKIDPSFPKY